MDYSTIVSTRVGVESTLFNFLRGTIDQYIPKTQQTYDDYRRVMHDIICLGLVEEQGYVDQFNLSKIGLMSNVDGMNRLTPDLYHDSDKVLQICEVAVSHDPSFVIKKKNEKYSELMKFLNENYKRTEFQVTVVDISDSEWKDTMPSIPTNAMNLFSRSVENLIRIHSTPSCKKFIRKDDSPFNFKFRFDHDLMKALSDEAGSESLTREYLSSYYDSLPTKLSNDLTTDSEYLDDLSKAILDNSYTDRPFPSENTIKPSEISRMFRDTFEYEANTDKIPKLLQLGMPIRFRETGRLDENSIISAFKSPAFSGGYAGLIKDSLRSGNHEGLRLKLRIDASSLREEMLQGPGRKKLLKMENIHVERKAPTHIGIKENHSSMLDSTIKDIQETDGNDFVEPVSMHGDWISPIIARDLNNALYRTNRNRFSSVLKFYQITSKEIILNSMRRRNKGEYVLCHTGCRDVYFLIAPGPQLRTESNVIFVKFISLTASVQSDLSRTWEPVNEHFESKWLSVDTDRLKHWARAYDRVLLTFISSAELLLNQDNDLLSVVKSEINNGNFSLLSLIYLENKQTTSTTIQTTRYTFMKSIGDRQISKVLPKFPQRINSVLQSVILQRTMRSLQKICFCPTSDWLTLNKVMRDEETGQIDDTTTGAVGTVPRIFTQGDDVPVKFSLYEMYMCMCYNKDRQNQTQDAMSILKKILKLESSMRDQLSVRDDKQKMDHLWGVHDTSEDIAKCVRGENREDHYFSRRAVSLGFKLQDSHKDNLSPSSGWCTISKMNEALNKNLSEFATFKASVAKVTKHVDPLILDEIKKIGNRTKCIELVYNLVNDKGFTMSRDVVDMFSKDQISYKVFIQIFKKNQVGGVREILILYIVSRILINVIESICITCSKSDKREILTKGKDKRIMMRGDYESLVSEHEKGKPLLMIRDSHDMSTWCQKFIPTIFQPFYQVHSNQLKDLTHYANATLVQHCLKEIEFPKHLIKQWITHPDIEHKEPYMQEQKKRFLETGQTTFTNLSNMGQGILHYNSTVLALACRSFRDALFEKCLQRLQTTKSISWRTKVGSDDVGELICVDLTKDDGMAQARLFGRVTEVSERLHAMECSVKSASGLIMYELNSAFMCNLEVLSPLIKFTLAAVDMVSTDSCTTFVNESYSRIRQLRENGGSSMICALAHRLNELHFYDVFKTGEMMTNDPAELLGIQRDLVPFDLGIYPLYDCDIQETLGPEYYNYRIFCDDRHDPKVFSMLYSSNVNLEEALISDCDGVLKKTITRISRGAVKQLVNMRERLGLDPEMILSQLEKTPLMLIRGPQGVEETKVSIASKLYTMGAAESLRRTSPAIYLGRIAAFESANAWDLIEVETKELFSFEQMAMVDTKLYKKVRTTYSNYLKRVYEQSEPMNFIELKGMLFPQHETYDSCRAMVKKFSSGSLTRKVLSQAVRTWVINNYNYQYTSSIKQIIESMLGLSEEARLDDVEEMRKFIPYDMSSIESFVEGCERSKQRPLEVFHYIMRTYKLSNSRTMQVFATGPNTGSFPTTVKVLKKFNHMRNMTFNVDGIDSINEVRPDATRGSRDEFMKFSFNLLMLDLQELFSEFDPLEKMTVSGMTIKTVITSMMRSIKKISGYSNQMRKLITFIAGRVLERHEFVRKLLDWNVFIFGYIQEQKKVNNRWSGDLRVRVCYMQECFDYVEDTTGKYLEFNRVQNPRDFNDALKLLCRSLEGVSYDMLFEEGRIRPGDYVMNKGIKLSSVRDSWGKRLLCRRRDSYANNTINTMMSGKMEWQINKDKSHSLIYTPYKGSPFSIMHVPGNYYPTEVPKSFCCGDEMKLSGVRLNLLFQNRSWFFDQRLPELPMEESAEILRTMDYSQIVRTKDMVKLQINELLNEDMPDDDFNTEEIFSDPYTSNVNLNNTKELEMSSQTIFDLFYNLKKSDYTDLINLQADPIESWADEVEHSPVVRETLDGDELRSALDTLEGFGVMIQSLGAPKKKKLANAYSIHNLLKSTSMQTRMLNYPFKLGNISNESKRDLPEYACHVKNLLEEETCLDRDYLADLYKLIVQTIVDVTGKDQSRIEKVISSLDPLNVKQIKLISYTHSPHNLETIEDLFTDDESSDDDEE